MSLSLPFAASRMAGRTVPVPFRRKNVRSDIAQKNPLVKTVRRRCMARRRPESSPRRPFAHRCSVSAHSPLDRFVRCRRPIGHNPRIRRHDRSGRRGLCHITLFPSRDPDPESRGRRGLQRSCGFPGAAGEKLAQMPVSQRRSPASCTGTSRRTRIRWERSSGRYWLRPLTPTA